MLKLTKLITPVAKLEAFFSTSTIRPKLRKTNDIPIAIKVAPTEITALLLIESHVNLLFKSD